MSNLSPKTIKYYKLNFGPQHPSAHGVLRLLLSLRGEIIYKADPQIGLLHRGTEKLIETKNYLKSLPYFDRLDYVSMLIQEHGYCLATEGLFNIEVVPLVQYIRVIFSEMTRILNHFLAITTHALDVGALTPFLWAFEEREKLFYFYEQISGARMHSAFFRTGGISKTITLNIILELFSFMIHFKPRIQEMEELLTNNRIWKQRLIDIGVVNKNHITSANFSGILARASGLSFDIRQKRPYEVYNKLNFIIPITNFGDSYSRYLLRVEEMKVSCILISSIIIGLAFKIWIENLYELTIITGMIIYSAIFTAYQLWGTPTLVAVPIENHISQVNLNNATAINTINTVKC